MWPFKSRKPVTASFAARNALGLPPADLAHSAIAEALEVSALPDGTTRIAVEAPGFFLDVPADSAGPTKVFTAPGAELSPEYHAGLASRMIERLDADALRLADAIAAERKQHKLTMTALYAELAGLKRVRKAYKVAGAVLQPLAPAPARDVQDAEDAAPVGPYGTGAMGETDKLVTLPPERLDKLVKSSPRRRARNPIENAN